MKAMFTILGTVAVLSITACSGEAPSGPESSAVATGDEAALTASSAATIKTIRAAVGVFAGGDAKRSHEITMTQAPAAVSAQLTKADAEMASEMAKDGWGSDYEKGVYEIFKTPENHTIVGYALWAYGDNGDAGQGFVRGFDLKGKQIVKDEDSWAAN